ncbi:MAG: DUF4386 domain-containing protein [Hyphomicrobiales bacterium]
MNLRKNAKIAGIAYLFYIAVGVANELLMSRATRADGTAGTLARVAQHATDVRLAVLFGIGESFSALVLAVTMYAITRDVGQELALMALVCRAAEGLINAVNVPKHMALLWLADATRGPGALDAGTTNALGTLFLMPGGPVGAVFFAVGSTLFSYLLLRGRMVPVVLAGFGVVSSVLLVIGLPLQLAGFVAGPLMGFLWLPEFAFAFAIGTWLMVKGVSAPVPR